MASHPSISTVQNTGFFGLADALFNEISLAEGLVEQRRGPFAAGPITLDELSALGDVLFAESDSDRATVVLRIEPAMLGWITVRRGRGKLAVAGTDRDAVRRVGGSIIESLRDMNPDESRVPITFWANSNGRPQSVRRAVPAPTWAEIRPNYAGDVQLALDELMEATEPGPGALLLWHGEPGTGKSFALRALAREWRGWCDTYFITDSESFLGANTNYLLNALLSPDTDDDEEEPRWRLVVLEDAGELLAADARALAGQAVSRLLNLTDGLLGVGLRAIVLVTTNEPIRRLHPAVVRPGRTWADVEFTALSAAESGAWLARRGIAAEVTGATLLAELFATADGRHVPAPASVGFAA